MLIEGLLSLLLGACLGLHAALAVVIYPLARQSGTQLVDFFVQLLLPRMMLFGLGLSLSAGICILWSQPTPPLLLSLMLFVALGQGMARHMLRIRVVLASAKSGPRTVLRPLEILNTAQLAVCTACVWQNSL